MNLVRKNGVLGLILVLLNLVDALFTIYFIKYRGAIEANPFMAFFIAKGFTTFFVVKMGMVTGCSIYIIRRSEEYGSLLRKILWIFIGLYGLLDFYHVLAYFGFIKGLS
jgi:hypothetical protein